MATLGIDFGTSNTAVGWMNDGTPELIAIEGNQDTLPTAVFLDYSSRKTLYGRQAAKAMMEGQDGRFLRALKSILGTPLAREKRQFMNEKLTLIEVTARFLSEIKDRAESSANRTFDTALSGRPVRFHSDDEQRDQRALVDLQEAYTLAGFESVSFLSEPEAAAMAVDAEGLNLIVDIGGGTSDFTICRRNARDVEILGSYGIRLGGTDFDRLLSLAHVMPLFGKGEQIGSEFGDQTHGAPAAIYNDLASWEKIAFVYNAKTLREVQNWQRLAPNPQPFSYLAEVLDMQLGHDVAYAVEAGKIAANSASAARIDLSIVSKGLGADLANMDLLAGLWERGQNISNAAKKTLIQHEMTLDAVDNVVFVGGSSMLGLVQQQMKSAFPKAQLITSDVFTAVVRGLAIASGQPEGLAPKFKEA